MVSSTSASTDPVDRAQPLAAALLILKELGESGRYVWLTSKAIGDQDERLFYLRQAIGHLRQRGREGPGKYHELPVDPRTFVECPMLLAMHGEVYPKIMVEIERMCSGRYVEAVLSGGIGCWPGEAEFLSPTGWVKLDAYAGQQVAEYEPETKTVTFREADYVDQPADGWWTFERSCFVKKVSPEHTVLLHGRSGAQRVVKAHELASGVVRRDSYTIPSTFRVDRPGVSLSDDELRLMVAVLADGNFHPGQRLSNPTCRMTLRRPRKRSRLEALLTRLGLAWQLNGPYPKRPTEVTYVFEAPLRTKSWVWAWACTEAQLHVLFEELPYWDGLHPDSTPTREWRFHTTDLAARDFVQYLCQATGHRAHIRRTEKTGKYQDLWCVQARLADGQSYRLEGTTATWSEPEPGERKYCFVTQTGFFIVRYRGNVMVSGNTGKTTMALIATAYSLYELSCMRAPHKAFGLAQSSEIEFIFQSLKKELAKEIDYARFKAMLDNSPYFQEIFRYDRAIESQLKFPKRIGVKPLTGAATAAIGQNVFGGVIDEINFMAVVEQSKTSTADGGVYDQAKEVYNSIARRRQSRFMVQGRLPGMLCLVSSKQYPGEFTDRKMAQALTDPTIFVYDKRVWEVKPEGTFSGVWFPVFVGDETRKPRLLGPTEPVAETDRDLVVDVPEEYRAAFEEDLLAALRDIAGVSTQALYPFLPDSDAVNEAFGKVASVLSRPDCDFTAHRLQIYPKRITKPEEPRFVHIDLGLSADHCGVACGYIQQFRPIPRGEDSEVLPTIVLDFILDVIPPRGGEIEFENIRKLLYALRNNGLPIKWVTLDSFQSVDSRQILARQGFVTGQVSLDKDTNGYDIAKQAFYDRRVLAPEHTHAQQELVRLERDPKTRKVDHPTRGSKDCADAIAGVISGLTTRRELWLRHGIPLRNIPKSLVRAEPAPAAVSQLPRRHVSYA